MVLDDFPYIFRTIETSLFGSNHLAETAKTTRINSRTARARLPVRREPYWQVVSAGCAIGYRRGKKGGTWVARFRDDTGKQNYLSLGAADDNIEADGTSCLSFDQAQAKGKRFFRVQNTGEEVSRGPYSVEMALDEYFNARTRRGSKGVKADIYAAKARIIPELGKIGALKLTAKRIRDWHHSLAEAPKLRRTKKFAPEQATATIDQTDHDAVRARRSTANRLLTILKAALNLAFQEGRIASDEAWRKVRPFRGVETAVIRYLTPQEITRLINACDPQFRNLVQAALLTGCRYGELVKARIQHFDPNAGIITIPSSKTDKGRHVTLNDEGQEFFLNMTAGRPKDGLIFFRSDGKPWGASHQQRPLSDASTRASISPAVTFHILRHTHASLLAMAGVPMAVIAKQLGHADTRMTEKHYAHLSPNYVSETVRASMPKMGIFYDTNIVTAVRSGKVKSG